jgi:hypothetical protein
MHAIQHWAKRLIGQEIERPASAELVRDLKDKTAKKLLLTSKSDTHVCCTFTPTLGEISFTKPAKLNHGKHVTYDGSLSRDLSQSVTGSEGDDQAVDRPLSETEARCVRLLGYSAAADADIEQDISFPKIHRILAKQASRSATRKFC